MILEIPMRVFIDVRVVEIDFAIINASKSVPDLALPRA
jgi:hypothetical protein